MIAYGWRELHECCYGIEEVEVDEDPDYEIKIVRGRFEEATPVNPIDDLSEGEWFTTYERAVNAQIKALRDEIKWRRRAIKDLERTKKKRPIATKLEKDNGSTLQATGRKISNASPSGGTHFR